MEQTESSTESSSTADKKRCPRCHKSKPTDEFPRSHFKTKDGRKNTCKKCVGIIASESKKKAKAVRKVKRKVRPKVLLDQPPAPPRKSKPKVTGKEIERLARKIKAERKPKRKLQATNGHSLPTINQALSRSHDDVFTRAIDKLVRHHVKTLHRALAQSEVEIESLKFEGQEYVVTYRKTERFSL